MATSTIPSGVRLKRLISSLVSVSTTETPVSFNEALSNFDFIMFNVSLNTDTAVQTVIFPPARSAAVNNGLKASNSGTERTMTISIAGDKGSATAVMSGGTWALDVWGIRI